MRMRPPFSSWEKAYRGAASTIRPRMHVIENLLVHVFIRLMNSSRTWEDQYSISNTVHLPTSTSLQGPCKTQYLVPHSRHRRMAFLAQVSQILPQS